LKEPGRPADKKSYMWVFGGGPPNKFSWIYQYHPSRSGDIPKQFFKGYSGYLHVDGYSGYHNINNGTILAGCWAHARRKFVEVAKAAKNKKGVAHHIINEIKTLYKIEKEAKTEDMSFDQIKQLRNRKSKPILDKLLILLTEKEKTAFPKNPIGKAIAYTKNQWHKLTQYLNDGRIEIDNNKSERAVKPFVIGRKNWMF
jgi:transposase